MNFGTQKRERSLIPYANPKKEARKSDTCFRKFQDFVDNLWIKSWRKTYIHNQISWIVWDVSFIQKI